MTTRDPVHLPLSLLAPLVAVISAGAILPSCDAPEEACRPGFVRAEDGHCYPPPPDPDPPSVADALVSFGPCLAHDSGTEIDLFGGCIEGACAQGAFASFTAAFGPVDCNTNDAGEWDCLWTNGVAGLFAPTDADDGGPVDTATTTYVRARYNYVGASPDGLGIGAGSSCFTEILGYPDSVSLVLSEGELAPQQFVWDLLGIEIEDEEREYDLLAFPDGLVDEITLFGP